MIFSIDAILREKNVELDENSTLNTFWDEAIETWSKKNLGADAVYDIYRDEIGWNLDMQLAWIAIFLGSLLGLLQIKPTNSEITYIYGILILGFSYVVEYSLEKVLMLTQKNLRNKLILNASIRFKNKSLIPIIKIKDLSIFQKNILYYPEGIPTLKKSLNSLFKVIIWGVMFLLVFY